MWRRHTWHGDVWPATKQAIRRCEGGRGGQRGGRSTGSTEDGSLLPDTSTSSQLLLSPTSRAPAWSSPGCDSADQLELESGEPWRASPRPTAHPRLRLLGWPHPPRTRHQDTTPLVPELHVELLRRGSRLEKHLQGSAAAGMRLGGALVRGEGERRRLCLPHGDDKWASCISAASNRRLLCGDYPAATGTRA